MGVRDRSEASRAKFSAAQRGLHIRLNTATAGAYRDHTDDTAGGEASIRGYRESLVIADRGFCSFVNLALLQAACVLATMAAIIASQALISGAFSLTLQAVQLGYSPRVQIEHTSARERGQIYIPSVNWALMAACIGLVLGFLRGRGFAHVLHRRLIRNTFATSSAAQRSSSAQ